MQREKHGKWRTPEYKAWQKMKDRCYNPNSQVWKHYGERGIQVCERWLSSFIAFYEDMGERPASNYSLDRIDNNAHYTPENCKWSINIIQSNNTRTNRMLTANGVSKTLSEWSACTGVHLETIRYRINHGWSEQDAITKPPSIVPANITYVTAWGKTQTVSEWAKEKGVHALMIKKRIKSGMTPEQAMTIWLSEDTFAKQ